MSRNIFITGGMGGIGQACVRKFIDQGDNVTFTFADEKANKVEAENFAQSFGSRARALAALAPAEITGARSEREQREKGLGRDILANCERKGVGSCRQRLRAAAFCISTGLLVCWRRRRRRMREREGSVLIL